MRHAHGATRASPEDPRARRRAHTPRVLSALRSLSPPRPSRARARPRAGAAAAARPTGPPPTPRRGRSPCASPWCIARGARCARRRSERACPRTPATPAAAPDRMGRHGGAGAASAAGSARLAPPPPARGRRSSRSCGRDTAASAAPCRRPRATLAPKAGWCFSVKYGAALARKKDIQVIVKQSSVAGVSAALQTHGA